MRSGFPKESILSRSPGLTADIAYVKRLTYSVSLTGLASAQAPS